MLTNKEPVCVIFRMFLGEKPYKCTYCEYATAQNSTLKIHLRRHHHGPISTESAQPSAAYVCEKCGQQFEERDTYQCHDAEQHTTTSSVPSSDQAATDDSDHIDSHSWQCCVSLTGAYRCSNNMVSINYRDRCIDVTVKWVLCWWFVTLTYTAVPRYPIARTAGVEIAVCFFDAIFV